MTVAHHTPPLPAMSLSSALGLLRARGLRVSASRRLVLEALFAADCPVTAADIAAGLKGRFPISDIASVYRNLELLERVGLIRHVHLGHGAGLYSLASRTEREFVTCELCGAFEILEPERLAHVRAEIESELGYSVGFTHFPLVGVCPACRSELDEEVEHAHP